MDSQRFFIPFKPSESQLKIDFNDNIFLIGSCFSTEIHSYFIQSGFRASTHLFGIAYNPESIANQIIKSIDLNKENNIFIAKQNYYDWESSNVISGSSEEDLSDKLMATRHEMRNQLMDASCLFITFGSAYAYRLNENKLIVANCHKQAARLFTKELLSLQEMQSLWQQAIKKIKDLNPNIHICFTVSPVRHVRDGIIENNRSKARLFELVSSLEKLEKVAYFPSYEIMIDELRDYRFYKLDRIHPSDEAIAYIWERFGEVYFSKATIEMIGKIQSVRKAENHQIKEVKSAESLHHIEETNRRKKELSVLEPKINWE